MIECPKCSTLNFSYGTGFGCRVCGCSLTTKPPHTHKLNAIAWDYCEETGIFPALVSSISAAVFHPFRFSKAIADKNGAYRAILFAVLIATLTTLLKTFFPQSPLPSLLPSVDTVSTSARNLVFSPAFAVMQVVFVGIYVHGMLFVTGHGNTPFTSTLRMAGYAQASMCLSPLPFVGAPLSALLFLYILLTATSLIYHISRIKVAFILILPGLLFLLITSLVTLTAAGTGLFFNDVVKELIFSLQ